MSPLLFDAAVPAAGLALIAHLTQFHEPMVLFGWMAALTQHLEFVTGVIILPQRQTVLIAKQAAVSGRFRLA